MASEKWKTAITKVEPNKITVRGYSIDNLMGRVPFAQAIYLVLKGELPSENEGKILDAIFVSSIDHGITPPSTVTALHVASAGADFSSALASGVLAISRFHGGAIETAMEIFYKVYRTCQVEKISDDEAVNSLIKEMREKKKVVSGFGHRLHTQDPRTKKLFELAEDYGISGQYVKIARSIEAKLHELTGKNLPINVDGAIAAILCELDFPEYFGNLFFILSRITGLAAHIHEEQTRYKPMRRIDPFAWEYDGPEERTIE